jgi:hypothetical protein
MAVRPELKLSLPLTILFANLWLGERLLMTVGALLTLS